MHAKIFAVLRLEMKGDDASHELRVGANTNANTTATGEAADRAKIAAFRRGCGEAPLALASGVTPDNVADYAPDVDAILVATGINRSGDFYEIDPARLRRLLAVTRVAARLEGTKR